MFASDVPRSTRARRSSYLATTPAYNNSATVPSGVTCAGAVARARFDRHMNFLRLNAAISSAVRSNHPPLPRRLSNRRYQCSSIPTGCPSELNRCSATFSPTDYGNSMVFGDS